MHGYESVVSLVRQAFDLTLLTLLEPLGLQERLDTLVERALAACEYKSPVAIKDNACQQIDKGAKRYVEFAFAALRDCLFCTIVEEPKDKRRTVCSVKQSEEFTITCEFEKRQAELALRLIRVIPDAQPGLGHMRISEDETELKTDFKFASHVETRELLLSIIIKQWATTRDEGEADTLFEGLRSIEAGYDTLKEYSELIAKCVREAGVRCSRERLGRHLEKLPTQQRRGVEASKSTFYGTLAVAWVRQVDLRNLHQLVGIERCLSSFSWISRVVCDLAWTVLADKAGEIARLCAMAKVLIDKFGFRVFFTGFDLAGRSIHLLLDLYQHDYHPRDIGAAQEQVEYELRTHNLTGWKNPDPEVTVFLQVRVSHQKRVVWDKTQRIAGPASA